MVTLALLTLVRGMFPAEPARMTQIRSGAVMGRIHGPLPHNRPVFMSYPCGGPTSFREAQIYLLILNTQTVQQGFLSTNTKRKHVEQSWYISLCSRHEL
jgi:hypothetical protein